VVQHVTQHEGQDDDNHYQRDVLFAGLKLTSSTSQGHRKVFAGSSQGHYKVIHKSLGLT